MSAPNLCEGCPLAKVHSLQLSNFEILKQTGIIQLEDYMARMEGVEERQAARIEATDYSLLDIDEEALEREDEEDEERYAQRRKDVGAFYGREFDYYDQGISEEQQKLEVLRDGCAGPALRRKYILLGSKVLKCRSKQASLWQRLQA
jgi:hypothetical protein